MKPLKRLFFIFLFAILLWAGGFGLFCYTSLSRAPEQPSLKTDAIVVLTGGYKRVETGGDLMAQGLAPQLFISGVNPDVTEQEIQELWGRKTPLHACCITLGRQATTTTENASETREWAARMKIKSIRLVTANYHMPRALVEFHHALPGVTIIPHPVVQPDLSILSTRFVLLMLSEYHKTLFRWVVLLFD